MVRFLFYGAVIYLLLGIRIVKPHEWLVITRSGKYLGFKKQGVHWVFPFLDTTEKVDLRDVSPEYEKIPDQILETKVHELASTRSSIR